jgi:hypothetical protein
MPAKLLNRQGLGETAGMGAAIRWAANVGIVRALSPFEQCLQPPAGIASKAIFPGKTST